MKQLTKQELKKVAKNLDNYFNLATKEDIENGKKWYSDAYHICVELANKYKTDTFTVASIISTLSPRNKWLQNIKDAETVLKAVENGLNPEEIKVSTFHTNKFKAFEIAKKNVFLTESSQKTFAFVNNIALLNDKFVTIDVWHLRGCFNETKGAIGKVAYKQIQKLTIDKAKKVGLKGYEYQAILWLSIQNNFNN
jgi:hypothetical protein